MFKLVLTAALSLTVLVAVASTEQQLQSNSASKHVLPVIVKNELVSPGLCRLHFENSASKDVSCSHNDHE